MSKALLEAAKLGNLEELNKILQDTNLDINATVNLQKDTVLHIAARHAQTAIVEALISRGASVNSLNYKNQTPLHYAAQQGHTSTVLALLKLKADVSLFDMFYQETPLHVAAECAHFATIEAMVKFGINSNIANPRGLTILHQIVMRDDPESIESLETLVKLGLNVNATIPNEGTALHIAARCNHINMLAALVRFGVNVNATNHQGLTPLQYIAVIELKFPAHTELYSPTNIPTIRTLIKLGAFLDIPFPPEYRIIGTLKKHIPEELLFPFQKALKELFEAASNSNLHKEKLDSIFSTLGNALDGRFQTNDDTALHIAIENNHELAVRLLLEGARYDISGKNKLNAIDILNNQKPSAYKNLCLAFIESNNLKNIVHHYKEKMPQIIQADMATPILGDVKSSMEMVIQPQPYVAAKRPAAAAAAASEEPAAAAGQGSSPAAAAGAGAMAVKNPLNPCAQDMFTAQKLDQAASTILTLLGMTNTPSLDEMDFGTTMNQEEFSASSYFNSLQQRICFEAGSLIASNLFLFPNSKDKAIKLLGSIKKDHHGFKTANSLLYEMTSDTVDNNTRLKRLNYLVSAGKQSVHYQIIGNLMADIMGHGLDNKVLRSIHTINAESMLKMFNLTVQLNKEKEKAETREREALIREQKLRDEISKLQSLSQRDTNADANQFGVGAKRNSIALTSVSSPASAKQPDNDESEPAAKKAKFS